MASFAYFHTRGGVIARKIEDKPTRSDASDSVDEDADTGSSHADRWFFDSSFDLKHGLVVREVAPEALPKDAFERLFHR